ncbi:MAG: NAD(P)-binding domain-containing protein [Candidatus Tectomicrobia bacterium]|nr:NAD(P)-binding domain-containing protein [Candidatus Tectomicrobia bacterium]
MRQMKLLKQMPPAFGQHLEDRSMSVEERYDVIIVGAGPAGLSAAAHAHKHNLNYLVLEQGTLANTMHHYYQYGKFVMSQPSIIPLRSDLQFHPGSREEILQMWDDYASEHHLNIRTNEPVKGVTKIGDGFEVKSGGGTYKSKSVVLAIGKLENRRRLNVPGENLDHVSDRLVDPSVYFNQDILAVGGGDSVAEVALALSENNRVAISNRQGEFYRMNADLMRQITDKIEKGKITAYFNTEVQQIEKGFVGLSLPDRDVRVKADFVFVKIGAEVPRAFLEQCGVTFPSVDISAFPILNEYYESTVPGLFLIGALGGQDLIKIALNQGYEVVEHILGREVEPVDEPLLKEKLGPIPGASVREKLTSIASTIPLLANVLRRQLREAMLLSTVRQLNKGDTIFQEHDYSTSLFIIVEGGVEIFRRANPKTAITLREGEFFGEMSLLSDRRRSATVKAADRSILIEIPRRTVLKLINSEPSVKRRIDEAFTVRTLGTYLCPDLSTDEFRKTAAKVEFITFRKGDVIFREEDPGDAFYMIRSGSVKISKKKKDLRDHIITYLHTGQYFGEMALLSKGQKRSATVTAATKTEVIRISSDDFMELTSEYPHLKDQVAHEVEKRNLETVLLLEVPENTEILEDFMKYGIVESTDILLIDETTCIRCNNCVSACAATHGGQARLDRKPGPSFAYLHVPTACRHCEGAPCLQNCPPGDAIVRDSKGVVKIDESKCIGCGNCAKACPYGVIFMVKAHERKHLWDGLTGILSLLRGEKEEAPPGVSQRTIAVKCDLCEGIRGGPACVRSCPTGAAIRVKPEYFRAVEFRN